jgi:hypothetical protein
MTGWMTGRMDGWKFSFYPNILYYMETGPSLFHPETCEQGRVRHSSVIPSGANWFYKALFAEHNWCSPLLIHNGFFSTSSINFFKKNLGFCFP